MPARSPKPHHRIRERLEADALARGRQLYLSSGVRELRIDVRRRRYSAIVDDGPNAITVKIEQHKDEVTWICSADGRNHPNCAHVAALLTAIREREAVDGDDGGDGQAAGTSTKPAERVSLVDHLMGEASREHLVQAFKLCLRTYPELQGDLVFTILENVDTSGELYDEVVAMMDDPAASKEFTLPKEGFDPYRLLDEINYLYEQERYQQAFLLSRAVLTRLLAKISRPATLADYELDLVIASGGMLSDLTLPPAPEPLAQQVHELGMRLLRRYPKLEPQIQSSLIALIDDAALGEADLQELEKSLRRRWERARKTGKDKREQEEAERLAMPLALFYARTQQFDKLQNLFDRYLQNPLLRAPALAEMLHHNLHEVVVEYVIRALVEPDAEVKRDDAEDIARCGMYNDLVMMLVDDLGDRALPDGEGGGSGAEADDDDDDDDGDELDEQVTAKQKRVLLRRAFMSIGHRIYGVLDVYREVLGEHDYQESLAEIADELEPRAATGSYVALTKTFVVLCELARYDDAFALLAEHGSVDPVILLDYLPNFLPKYEEQLFDAALQSVVELLPLVTDDSLRTLVRGSITRLWDLDEAATREVLNRHFIDIADDELADFVDVLLGDLEPDELGL